MYISLYIEFISPLYFHFKIPLIPDQLYSMQWLRSVTPNFTLIVSTKPILLFSAVRMFSVMLPQHNSQFSTTERTQHAVPVMSLSSKQFQQHNHKQNALWTKIFGIWTDNTQWEKGKFHSKISYSKNNAMEPNNSPQMISKAIFVMYG